MKIIFITTTNDPITQVALAGIAQNFNPCKTLRFFWGLPKKSARSLVPTPRRVINRFNSLARNYVDSCRTKQIEKSLSGPTIELPNQQEISTRAANTKKTVEMLTALEPDFIVVCGGPIFKKRIFSIPKIGTINIHFGISSAYRGQHTLLWPMMENRFDQIGATIHLIDQGIDTGDVLFEYYPEVTPEDDEVSLEIKIAHGIVEPLVEMLKKVQDSSEKKLTGLSKAPTGKEIRYRDLGVLNSSVYAIKKRLGLVKLPHIEARIKKFYEVS